ncbi:MAG: ParA family partition ATPase [Pseudomonadota bacterium]
MPGKIITIAQQKGGSGKTTLAAHLAVAALQRVEPLTVALLDTDPQGSLGQWFVQRSERLGEDKIDLGFRTASAWGARLEAVNLAKDHDLVIVDTPPKADWDCRPAMEAADLVLIPVLPSPVDVWATKPTLEAANSQKADVLLVMNRVVANARLTAEMAEAVESIGAPVAAARLGSRVAFASGMGDGATVLETARSSKAAKEASGLFQEIATRLERA